jgi:hypothetical protein
VFHFHSDKASHACSSPVVGEGRRKAGGPLHGRKHLEKALAECCSLKLKVGRSISTRCSLSTDPEHYKSVTLVLPLQTSDASLSSVQSCFRFFSNVPMIASLLIALLGVLQTGPMQDGVGSSAATSNEARFDALTSLLTARKIPFTVEH